MKHISAAPSDWLRQLPRYPFVELRNKKDQLRKKGIKVLDFSIGDPTSPTPDFVVKAATEAMTEFQCSGYPDNRGLLEFRKAVSDWNLKRFGITLDPEREIFASLGAKEAVFAFPNALQGGGVIVPTPGYPPYYSGALAAGKRVHLVPLRPENRFLPDLSSIPTSVAKDARLFWINYPNNPTTVLATEKFYLEIIEFCRDHDIILASDECYSEMYNDKTPESILHYSREGVIVFQSLSKRSNMTGWRVGYMAGDADIIAMFLSAKENMDSGCANFVQKAAAVALSDETHVAAMRGEYNRKRSIMQEALGVLGLPRGFADGTFYIWQPVPPGMRSLDFAARLLEEDIAIVVTPGPALATTLPDGANPGEGFVRFALVPSVEETKEAARRLVEVLKLNVRQEE
jgi:LL-diaminopimelate aminotransferase